jgi:hypothetical protein
VRLHIRTASPLLIVRHTARLLNSLVVIHDGLVLALDSQPPYIYDKFYDVMRPGPNMASPLVEYLRRAGENLLSRGEWPDLGWQYYERPYDVAIQVLLRMEHDDDLELESLQGGSTIAVIKKGSEIIYRRLKGLLSKSGDLLPGRDRAAFTAAIEQSLSEAAIDSLVHEISAGVVAVGAENLATTFAAMRAEAIDVEDEGFQEHSTIVEHVR